MMFGKWKRRAYEEFERNAFLEAEIRVYEERIGGLLTAMEENPICRQVLDLKLEVLNSNKQPTKVYLTARQECMLSLIMGEYTTNIPTSQGGIQTVYGLEVHTTHHEMRVE